MTSIFDVLVKATQIIKKNSIPTPRLDCEVILSYLLGVDRSYLIINSNEKLNEVTINKFNKLILRRLNGEPVAYIVENQEFMGLNYYVNKNVLIPRPDTEILVEYVIKYCNNMQKEHINILDIGTGSGAIGLSIAKYIHKSKVTLSDISNNALKIAKINANNIGVSKQVNYCQSDCLDTLVKGKYDIIISNPPYIPTNEISYLQKEVKEYEPQIALDGGDDGLLYYRKIIKQSKEYLCKNALVIFEIGYNQSIEVMKLLNNAGYKNIQKIKDLGLNDRVVRANAGTLENNKRV
ncbi:MAG: peptide chain release factor N(5)-glutamine methyltransferase [Eubacteriaceae bacterium]